MNKLNAGNQIQAQSQSELDAYQQERDRELGYNAALLNNFRNILTAYQPGTTSVSTQSANPYLNALGAGMMGYRVFNQNPAPSAGRYNVVTDPNAQLPWRAKSNVATGENINWGSYW